MVATPATLKSYRTGQGDLVELGPEVGRGGEATVYASRDGVRAVKLYHRPNGAQAAKLEAMIAAPPLDPTRSRGHVSLAWPEDLVWDDRGGVAGFVMPLVNRSASVPLYQLYSPKSRRSLAPGVTWRHLVRIAHNVSSAVAALHAKGYVVGDLNESNVLVADNALVTLVDCDSVQVRAGNRLHRCPVGKAEFTPPELQGKDLSTIELRATHDVFALAVLIFMLLMEGTSPFAGVYRGEGEAPGVAGNIRNGHSPYLSSGSLDPSPLAPPFSLLPPHLRKMVRRSLKRRSWWPRPSAIAWRRHLHFVDVQLVSCTLNPGHTYCRHLRRCPWCERLARLGVDAYPAAGAQAAATLPTPPARSQPEVGGPDRPGRKELPAFHRRVPLVTCTLLALAGLLAMLAIERARLDPAAMGLSEWAVMVALASGGVLGAAALLFWAASLAGASARLRRLFERSERVLQAVTIATAAALALTEGAAVVLGTGSALSGDWLLLPAVWSMLLVLVWKAVGRSSSGPPGAG